jgi:hypothetical protein
VVRLADGQVVDDGAPAPAASADAAARDAVGA